MPAQHKPAAIVREPEKSTHCIPVIGIVSKRRPAGGAAAPLEDAAVGDAGVGACAVGIEREALGAGDAAGQGEVEAPLRRARLDLRRGARGNQRDEGDEKESRCRRRSEVARHGDRLGRPRSPVIEFSFFVWPSVGSGCPLYV